MTYKEMKRKLGLTDADIAGFFSYKTPGSFSTSSAKKRIENGLVQFYEHIQNNRDQ